MCWVLVVLLCQLCKDIWCSGWITKKWCSDCWCECRIESLCECVYLERVKVKNLEGEGTFMCEKTISGQGYGAKHLPTSSWFGLPQPADSLALRYDSRQTHSQYPLNSSVETMWFLPAWSWLRDWYSDVGRFSLILRLVDHLPIMVDVDTSWKWDMYLYILQTDQLRYCRSATIVLSPLEKGIYFIRRAIFDTILKGDKLNNKENTKTMKEASPLLIPNNSSEYLRKRRGIVPRQYEIHDESK